MIALGKKFASTVLPAIIKPLRVLWNELLGTLFLAFAILLVRPTWRSYQGLDDDPANLIKLVLSIFFFGLMAGFGIHAFWRARRINRS